jgi:hypothetical protein
MKRYVDRSTCAALLVRGVYWIVADGPRRDREDVGPTRRKGPLARGGVCVGALVAALLAAPPTLGDIVDVNGTTIVTSTWAITLDNYYKTIGPLVDQRTIGNWGGAIYDEQAGTAKETSLKERIDQVHSRGALFFGSINTPGYHLRNDVGYEKLRLDGKTLAGSSGSGRQEKCWIRDNVYHNMLHTIRRSVDLGMDGNIWDSYDGRIHTMCFCSACVKLYREHLVAHRHEAPYDKFIADNNITEISTFDYRAFLLVRGHDNSDGPADFPLGWKMQRARWQEVVRRRAQAMREGRQYAASPGKPFIVIGNVFLFTAGEITHNRAMWGDFDFLFRETPYILHSGHYPPRDLTIAYRKSTPR